MAWNWYTVKKHLIGRGLFDESRQVEIKNGFCKVRHHSNKETNKHFMTKSGICFLINRLGDIYFSEYPFENRVFDVLQIKKSGEIVIYEVESVKNDKDDKHLNIREIRLKDVPEELTPMMEYLTKVVV